MAGIVSENYSEWDRYGADKDSDFGESFNVITIGYDTEKGAEAISAIDSVKKANDYEAFQRMGKQHDSLILFGPAKYFGNIGHDSSESKFSQKLGFFRTLLRKDSITVFNDVKTKYDVPDTFGDKLAFDMSDGL